MTPRTISALLQLRERRRLGEQAELLRLLRIAAVADDKTFKRVMKKLEDEGQ